MGTYQGKLGMKLAIVTFLVFIYVHVNLKVVFSFQRFAFRHASDAVIT